MFLFAQYITTRGLPKLPLAPVSRSRCITCQDVCVQQSHAGLTWFQRNPDCTPK